MGETTTHWRVSRQLVTAVVLGIVLSTVFIIVDTPDPADATTLQSTVLSPVTGTVTSNPAEPHHTPWDGDYAWDIAAPAGTAVYARFRNTNGTLSLEAAGAFEPCASPNQGRGGLGLLVIVSINGQRVGTIRYVHLRNIVKTSGTITPGQKIGEVSSGTSSSCWTGAHVHVEPRNDVKYGCYFPKGLGTAADGSTPLGLIGGERATAKNTPCPSGAETTGSPPFGNFDSATSPEATKIRVRGWAIDNDAKTTALTIHVYVGGPAGSGAEGHSLVANKRRDDVAAAYPGTGSDHGFDETFVTGRRGSQQVCAYAINVGGGSNTSLGCKTVTIAESTTTTTTTSTTTTTAPAPPSSPDTFLDDDGNVHEPMIEAIVEAGITEGCSGSDPKLYCPSLGVTRGQMASFLQRALDLPAASRDWFRDDDGNVHEDAINRIADAGIASGTSADRFSPDLGVTRAQMASFIARAFDTPPAPGHPFDDVAADSVHADAISSVAQEGIVHGCNAAGTLYCPAAPVRRDQMASFLGRALQLEPAP